MRLDDLRALRLELPQPVHGALEPVDAAERVHVAVGDDAEAGAAGSERDQPHPVAHAHQVVRALPAEPRRRRAPARPDRSTSRRCGRASSRATSGVGAVRARADEPELALQQPGPAAGVDDPARRDLGATRRVRTATRDADRCRRARSIRPGSRRGPSRRAPRWCGAACSRAARDRAGTTAPAGNPPDRARRAP